MGIMLGCSCSGEDSLMLGCSCPGMDVYLSLGPVWSPKSSFLKSIYGGSSFLRKKIIIALPGQIQ